MDRSRDWKALTTKVDSQKQICLARNMGKVSREAKIGFVAQHMANVGTKIMLPKQNSTLCPLQVPKYGGPKITGM